MDTISDKISELNGLIGDTPLIEIYFKYKGIERKIYTKLEYYNYTGSIKDRMALYILKKAYLEQRLNKDSIIIEATSGNTGISFAAIGAYLGNPVEIYMPDWMSEERKKILQSFGAKLHLLTKDDGGFLQCIVQTIERSEKDKNIFLPSQFSNIDNLTAHYLSTGPEIIDNFNCIKRTPSAFVAGAGTGGTIMGVGKFLKEYNNLIKIYAVEPANSPTLSSNIVSHHRIQGIVDEFSPPLLDINKLDGIIPVDDGDAIIMAQMLSHKLGLGVGISSGSNFIAAIKCLENLNPNSNIVTVFPDDNKKYLTTDLMNIEPIKDNYISPNVKLIGIRTICR